MIIGPSKGLTRCDYKKLSGSKFNSNDYGKNTNFHRRQFTPRNKNADRRKSGENKEKNQGRNKMGESG